MCAMLQIRECRAASADGTSSSQIRHTNGCTPSAVAPPLCACARRRNEPKAALAALPNDPAATAVASPTSASQALGLPSATPDACPAWLPGEIDGPTAAAAATPADRGLTLPNRSTDAPPSGATDPELGMLVELGALRECAVPHKTNNKEHKKEPGSIHRSRPGPTRRGRSC